MPVNSTDLINTLRLGEVYISQNRYKDAINLFGKELSNHPNSEKIHYCMGVAYHLDNQILNSIRSYCEAISIEPSFCEAYENLSQAQFELNLLDDALISINFAIKLNSKNVRSLLKKVNILNSKNQYFEAVEIASKAINIDPQFADAYCARSNAFRNLNETKKSIKDLKKAIKILPQDPIYHFNLSHELLLLGKFEEGLIHYESRFKIEKIKNNNNLQINIEKLINIKNVKNKKILVLSEQGFGDQIQYSRYLLELKKLGAEVTLEIAPPLLNCLESILGNEINLACQKEVLYAKKYDYYCYLMSMPLIFNTRMNSIPKLERYIKPNNESISKWKKILTNKNKKIGFCISGNPNHINDTNRNIKLKQFLYVISESFEWHLIQKDINLEDYEELLKNKNINFWNKELTDFNVTAGLIKNMEIVITVDTSLAHLAASMGKTTWLMLPFAPDFRWLLKTDTSPWYDSVTLFRQTQPLDWSNVINEVRNKLDNHFNSITNNN